MSKELSRLTNWEAVVRGKPSESDPREQAIREKIRQEVLQYDWAVRAFAEIKRRQVFYLREVLTHKDDLEFIHRITQDTLREIASLLRPQIVQGGENLLSFTARPVLIPTNHFGAYKLLGINLQEDIGIAIEGYDFMYPFLMYFAALYPVAERLEDKLYYVSNEFPGVLGEVHEKAGFIHVPLTIKTGKTAHLQEQTRALFEERKNAALVNFPEGGTSGKYSDGGIYDLDPFKTGGYVVAANLGVPVVPVAQYFNPQKGFEIRVFDPYTPTPTDKEGYERYAAQDRAVMQSWLDERRASSK